MYPEKKRVLRSRVTWVRVHFLVEREGQGHAIYIARYCDTQYSLLCETKQPNECVDPRRSHFTFCQDEIAFSFNTSYEKDLTLCPMRG